MNNKVKWFEPVPELEGDMVEVNKAILQANIMLLNDEKVEEEDDDGEKEAD